MKIIKRIIPSLLVASSIVYADVIIDSIGVNLGYAKMNNKQTDKQGSVTLASPLDESFRHLELYTLIGGVFDDENWKPTINYLYATNNEFENSILAIGLNRYLVMGEFNIYGGVLAGMGKMVWKRNPINNAKDVDYQGSSFVAIAQVGAEYGITKKLLVGLHTKYYLNDYEALLEPTNTTQTTITHDYGYSISLGVRYRFITSNQYREIEQVEQTVTEKKPILVAAIEEVPIVEEVQEVKAEVVPLMVIALKDSDNDGVVDEKDNCSDTPKQVKVNAKGCALDSDSDGVADYIDNCVDTPEGFSIDENGCEIALNLQIKFPSSSAEILPEYDLVLEKFAEFLNKFPAYKATINAYSDTSGNSKKNLKYSQLRAESIYNELINLGIPVYRLSHKGMGEKNPIASNATKEGRDKNRRAEIILVK